MQITDWDDAYAQAAHIPGADRIYAGWQERSADFLKRVPPELVRYGAGQRQVIDLFRPEQAVQGLTFFVHGGYWMMLSGRDFAHLAAGPLARGQAVAMITYTLAPEARIRQITAEVARGVAMVAQYVEGPIRLIGHSAGGHLVSRMACHGVLPDQIAGRIAHVVSVSGVHDLRPLLRTKMTETLRLTEAEALTESPALLRPMDGLRLTCVVGTAERPEFLRQNALLANIWKGLGAETEEVELPGKNHFGILDGLETADGALTRLLLDQTRS